MKIISLLAFCGMVYSANAQQDLSGISIRTVTPLVFEYNGAEELLQSKIIRNAIEINLGSATGNCNVFTQLTAGQKEWPGNVSLALNSTVLKNAAYNNRELKLSKTPGLLFSKYNTTNNKDNSSLLCDVKIDPFTEFITPGDYTFFLTFTITNQ